MSSQAYVADTDGEHILKLIVDRTSNGPLTISESIKDIGFYPECVRCLTNGHIAVSGSILNEDAFVYRLATLDADLNVVSQNTTERMATSILELRGRLLIGMHDGMTIPLLF